MGNNWFKKAKNLEENKSNVKDSSYFKTAGDLSTTKPNNSMTLHFTKAGDLEDTKKESNSFKFKEKEESLKTANEIREWLKTIVSGKKKSNYAFGEGLLANYAGQKFVGLDELKQMVDNGDNIISAEYFEYMNMVLIEFESFSMPSKSR